MLISYFSIFNLEDQRLWELSQEVVSQNPLAGQSMFYLLFVFKIGNEESILCALAASTERTVDLWRPGRHVVLIASWMAGVACLPLAFWRQVPWVKACQCLGLMTVRQPRSGRGSHYWRPCFFHAVLCYPGYVSGKLWSLFSSLLPIDQIYSFPSLLIALGK